MLRILTTLHNARSYIEKCVDTIQKQSVSDWRCYVLNDLSDDGSEQKVAQLAKHDKRIILIDHTERLYQVGAYCNALSRPDIADGDICVSVDGDDWLPDAFVFQRIIETYADPNVWLTWGSMLVFQDDVVERCSLCQPLSSWHDIRAHAWVTSHLRTWKAFLYRAIDPRDLRDRNGNYWRMSGDQAFMLPMLEMAGPEHSKFLKEWNYVYNNMNPLSDWVLDARLQNATSRAIRALPPYGRLNRSNALHKPTLS